MSYIGAAPAASPQQFFKINTQSFNGNGSTTSFTLTRAVASPDNIEVVVNNVQQSPFDGSYTVSGLTTLLFSEAPSSGTNNIYVVYRDQTLPSLIDTGAVRLTGNETIAGNKTFSGSVAFGTGGGGNNLGVLVSRGATTNFYEAYDGTKTYIAGVDNTNDYIKIGSLSSHPTSIVTGNVERIRVDTSGRVTMPYQPFARASSDAFAAATSVIPLNTWVTSRGGISTSSNRFTVPVAGAYVIGYHHLGNTGSGACQVQIRVNGSALGGTSTQDTNSSNDSFGTQTIAVLAANDYIEFVCITGTTHNNPSYNSMWAYLIG